MTHVLKGEAFTAVQLAVPLGMCVVVTVVGVAFVARALGNSAVR